MHSALLLAGGLIAAATAQVSQVQELAYPVVILSTTKSGVLPSLPTPFTGVRTEQGAVVDKGAANASYIGLNGLASTQSGMPQATYVAKLPSVMYNPGTGATISGSITGSTNKNGTGVSFQVSFAGFPSVSQYGPFVYHVHDLPVPADGNCTAALGHLDPTNRGEFIPCTAANPASCQAGDLAGKHGKINDTTFSASYNENFLSTDPNSPYFFGSKSIVIHTGNTTRLICANFVLDNDAASTSTSTSTSTITASGGSGSSSSGSSSTGSASTSGASSTSTGTVVGGIAGGPTHVTVNGAGRTEIGVAAAGLLLAGALAALF